jgi:transmembrane sensor
MSRGQTHAEALMGRCLDGVASDEDAAELDRLLRTGGPAVARALAAAVRFEGLLEEAVRTGVPGVGALPPLPAPRWGRGRLAGLAAGGVAAAAVVLLCWWLVPRRERPLPLARVAAPGAAAAITAPPPRAAAAPPPQARRLDLADGSTATFESGDAAVRVRTASAGLVIVELTRGRVRFDVVPRHERRFRVMTGAVEIEVLGTIFTVDRAAAGDPGAASPQRAETVAVTVQRGLVRVTGGGAGRRLAAGESALFDGGGARAPGAPAEARAPRPRRVAVASAPALRAAVAPEQPPAPGADASPPAPPSLPPPPQARSAPAAVEPPRFTSTQTGAGPGGASGDVAGALLKTAETARLAGQPAQAASALRTIVDKLPRDPRAPYAAFMMGRLLLDDLDRPHEAADAFATVRRLEPSTPLAEDALAREIAAWSRAGQPALARERAKLFLSRFPDSARTDEVRGIVDPR